MGDADDVCGHPTDGGDGPPCQHPVTDGDSCWLEAHGGDSPNGGRPTEFTESKARDAIDAAREGFSKAGCARAAGVGEATLQRWLDADHVVGGEDFRSGFMRARHSGERRLVTGPLVERPDDEHRETIDGQHARFLLSTSFGYTKTEKREHDVDATIDVEALDADEKEHLDRLFDRDVQE